MLPSLNATTKTQYIHTHTHAATRARSECIRFRLECIAHEHDACENGISLVLVSMERFAVFIVSVPLAQFLFTCINKFDGFIGGEIGDGGGEKAPTETKNDVVEYISRRFYRLTPRCAHSIAGIRARATVYKFAQ